MAADMTQALWGKHFEKIVLAAALVIFVVSLAVFAAMRSSQERIRTDVENLVKEIQEKRKAPALPDALTPEEYAALIAPPPFGGADFEKQLGALPDTYLAKVAADTKDKWVEALPGKQEGPRPEKPRMPDVEAVADLQVFKGRGTTAEAVPGAVFLLEGKPALSDIVWAGVIGHFDLTAQQEAFLNAKNPLPPDGILLSRVEVQRRELKPDGSWSDWKDVRPSRAAALDAKWPKLPANPRDKAAARTWYTACKTLQAEVRRMPLHSLLVKDPEGQTAEQVVGAVTGVEQPHPPRPKEEAPAAAPAEAPAAAPAAPAPAASASPWATTGVQPTPTTTAGATPEPAAPKHVLATLWAYDATVEPGKTYQYQMRAATVSPVYSHPDVEDDKTRWTLEFYGPWSKPSREVTIPGLADFFFIGTSGDRANVSLHRWILGQWVIQPSVSVSIGAPIAYTRSMKLAIPGAKEGTKESATAGAVSVEMNPGAFVVDVIRAFPYLPEGGKQTIRTNVLVFADAKGLLARRLEWDDKNENRSATEIRKGGPVVKPPTPPTPPPTPPPPKPKPERKPTR